VPQGEKDDRSRHEERKTSPRNRRRSSRTIDSTVMTSKRPQTQRRTASARSTAVPPLDQLDLKLSLPRALAPSQRKSSKSETDLNPDPNSSDTDSGSDSSDSGSDTESHGTKTARAPEATPTLARSPPFPHPTATTPSYLADIGNLEEIRADWVDWLRTQRLAQDLRIKKATTPEHSQSHRATAKQLSRLPSPEELLQQYRSLDRLDTLLCAKLNLPRSSSALDYRGPPRAAATRAPPSHTPQHKPPARAAPEPSWPASSRKRAADFERCRAQLRDWYLISPQQRADEEERIIELMEAEAGGAAALRPPPPAKLTTRRTTPTLASGSTHTHKRKATASATATTQPNTKKKRNTSAASPSPSTRPPSSQQLTADRQQQARLAQRLSRWTG